MESRARRELRFLRGYSLLLSALLGALVATAFQRAPQSAQPRE
jgi:hypothetical protein